MGLLAAALSAKVREPEARDIVGSIKLSVEALERLFSALMDISKLDAGGVAPARAPVALAALFGRIERQFAPLAASRGLRLAVVQTRAWVDSDAVLLERIVANLVANALNYTERGGAVRRCAAARREAVDRCRRLRHRHRGRRPRPHIRRVLSGRDRTGEWSTRHGPGIGHRPPSRPPAGPSVRTRFRAGARFALFGGCPARCPGPGSHRVTLPDRVRPR